MGFLSKLLHKPRAMEGAEVAADEQADDSILLQGKMPDTAHAITQTLLTQRAHRVKRGFYWENQIAFAYNSNRIEGNLLTRDQTRAIFETRSINGTVNAPVDDVIETRNHFRMFDEMLDTLADPLTPELMKRFHFILKSGTSDDLDNPDFNVGGWKGVPNRIGDVATTPPSRVPHEIDRLMEAYSAKHEKDYSDIATFHALFERIHPFQDGNGRVGRLIAFRECLANDLVPFIVIDEQKGRYYQGLKDFGNQGDSLVNFIREMSGLYLQEYTSLIPEYLLLSDSRASISAPHASRRRSQPAPETDSKTMTHLSKSARRSAERKKPR